MRTIVPPTLRAEPGDEARANLTVNGRCTLSLGDVLGGLHVIFDDLDAATVAVDQWSHDLAQLRSQEMRHG